MTVINTDEITCHTSVDARRQQRSAEGALGDHACVLYWGNGRCDRFRVRIDVTGAIAAAATNDDFQVRKTVCHEIGHTVGLWHYGNGDPCLSSSDTNGSNNCMRSGTWDSGASWTRVYGYTDIGVINANW